MTLPPCREGVWEKYHVLPPSLNHCPGCLSPGEAGDRAEGGVQRRGTEEGRGARPPASPLTPTLAFPVMPRRKLRVRRRGESAQVPEPPSSWLQLQREKEEVKGWRLSWKRKARCSRRDGGRRRHARRGERRSEKGLRKPLAPPPPPGCARLLPRHLSV